jgi:cation diffusion facilitator family transporter
MVKDTLQQSDRHANLTAAAARGIRATVAGILASTVLATVKIFAGVVGNSYALIADGVESLLDIISSLVVWTSLRIASQPPNEKYPYGYGKVEPLAGLAVATALFAAAVGIAIQSVREITTPHHIPEAFTLFVLVGVVATKEIMFRMLRKEGAAIGSHAMQTDAWHHRSDALTSLAAFIGISIALTMGEGYESADDWAALFACVIIGYNAVRLFRATLTEVLDTAPPAEVDHKVRAIAAAVDGVFEIEKCRIRKSGLSYFVDIHVEVDGEISVRRGHEIAHDVKDALLDTLPQIADVIVHIEPFKDTNP